VKLLRRILLFSLLSLLAGLARAQIPFSQPSSLSNLRVKKIPVSGDSVLLENVSIIPYTFRISEADTSSYRLDFVRAILYWKQRPGVDSVTLTYRVFPNKLNAVAQRLSYDSVVNNFYLKPFSFNNNESAGTRGFLDFGNIQANGVFERNLAFGNNQDAVVNSTFQLQLNGMLRDSIEIAAALTDNNIPIQPDGTTQQLNEFDQVYLQFKKKNWQLNLGDIDLRQNGMYFLNFYKRLQGITFQTTNALSPSLQSSTLVSGSVAKGKFSRNIITPQEGNQGPYRLTGANNEFFFIVLANTERVFIDGELMQRGEDQDYVINYNTAEVTFMPRRMITKDSRIQIEFEYADRNYLNANFYAYQELLVNKKLKFKIGAFNNSDARNSPINQNLDPQQRRFLFNVGDSIRQALYPTVVMDSFTTDKILYEKVYITTGPLIDSYYRYSVDPALARYSLSFTELGEGRGNYRPDFNGANGKVFRYIGPVNGVKQGTYEPVMVLVTPKKQQLISFGSDYQINATNNLKTELALSNQDVNTFSSRHGGDDAGLAARVQYSNTSLIRSARSLQVISTIDYEHVQQKFRPLERLRYVEFSREWGLPLQMAPADENILRLATQLKDKKNHSVTYQFTTYQRSDSYKGYQNLVQHVTNLGGWMFNNQFALTNFKSVGDKGYFLRPIVDLSKQLKKVASVRVGFRYALERNEIRSRLKDSISALSFSFDTYSAYLKSDESKKNKFGISFFTRADKYPTKKNLVKGDRSYNMNVQAELLKSTKHQFIINTTYRILKVYEPVLSRQKDDKTILGRAEYTINELKGFITGNVLYDLGTGQEQRRDFAYLEVPAGQGEFTWIDYNSDNIQQLNEFEVALFPDQAKFLRIFIPTNQFTKANYTTLNYSFSFNPRVFWNKQDIKGLRKLVSRFTWQTSMQKSKKATAGGEFEFNPFKYGLLDTALITLNTSLLNTLSFNRFSNKWGVDVSNVQNTGKALLTYGYESRKQQDWIVKFRVLLSKSITFDVDTRKGMTALYTGSFANRNYEIDRYSTEPRLSYVRGTTFRLLSSYRMEQKKNREEYGGQQTLSHALNLETKYNVLQNSSLNARFTFNNINYKQKGPENPTVNYIILDGLLPGRNFLWAVDFTRRLFGSVELNLQYEGRKPGETRSIHTGRAALRALL
jgi:hypothetical protein